MAQPATCYEPSALRPLSTKRAGVLWLQHQMAGELWRNIFQIAKEVTPGTAVATATRRLYWAPDSVLSIERDPRPHRFATGTRDNVRSYTNGPIAAGGSMSAPMSDAEGLEIFNIGIGTPVITTPTGGTLTRLHTYKPGDLESATIQWHDGKRVHQGSGYRANTVTIAGAVNEANTISSDLFGANVTSITGVTAGLAERTPTFTEGWQARYFVEAFAGVPGTTVITGALTNWSVQINNNLGRVYTADNTLSANRVIAGELDVTATLTLDADVAHAATEFTNWAATTARMVRLEFQDETTFIETTFRRFVTIDIPGNWTSFNLGGSGDGVRRYELGLQSVYQSTLAAMIQIRCQTDRTAAF